MYRDFTSSGRNTQFSHFVRFQNIRTRRILYRRLAIFSRPRPLQLSRGIVYCAVRPYKRFSRYKFAVRNSCEIPFEISFTPVAHYPPYLVFQLQFSRPPSRRRRVVSDEKLFCPRNNGVVFFFFLHNSPSPRHLNRKNTRRRTLLNKRVTSVLISADSVGKVSEKN